MSFAGNLDYTELVCSIVMKKCKVKPSITKLYPGLADDYERFNQIPINKKQISAIIKGEKDLKNQAKNICSLCNFNNDFPISTLEMCKKIHTLQPRSALNKSTDIVLTYLFRNFMHLIAQTEGIFKMIANQSDDHIEILVLIPDLLILLSQCEEQDYTNFLLCLREFYIMLKPELDLMVSNCSEKITAASLEFLLTLTKLVKKETSKGILLTYQFLIDSLLSIEKFYLPYMPLVFISSLEKILDTLINYHNCNTYHQKILSVSSFLLSLIGKSPEKYKSSLVDLSDKCVHLILLSYQDAEISPSYIHSLIIFAQWWISVFTDSIEERKPYTIAQNENYQDNGLPKEIPHIDFDALINTQRAIAELIKKISILDGLAILFIQQIHTLSLIVQQRYFGLATNVLRMLDLDQVMEYLTPKYFFSNESIFTKNINEADGVLLTVVLSIIKYKYFKQPNSREDILDTIYELIEDDPVNSFELFRPFFITILYEDDNFVEMFLGGNLYKLFVDYSINSFLLFEYISHVILKSPENALVLQSVINFITENIGKDNRHNTVVEIFKKGMTLSTDKIENEPITFSISLSISSLIENHPPLSIAQKYCQLVEQSINDMSDRVLKELIFSDFFSSFVKYAKVIKSQDYIESLFSMLTTLSIKSPYILQYFMKPTNPIYKELEKLWDLPFSITKYFVGLTLLTSDMNTIRNKSIIPLLLKGTTGDDKEVILNLMIEWSKSSLNNSFCLGYSNILCPLIEIAVSQTDERIYRKFIDIYNVIASFFFNRVGLDGLIVHTSVARQPADFLSIIQNLFFDENKPNSFFHFTGFGTGIDGLKIGFGGNIGISFNLRLDYSALKREDCVFLAQSRQKQTKFGCIVRNSKLVFFFNDQEFESTHIIASIQWSRIMIQIEKHMAMALIGDHIDSFAGEGLVFDVDGEFEVSVGKGVANNLYGEIGPINISTSDDVYVLTPHSSDGENFLVTAPKSQFYHPFVGELAQVVSNVPDIITTDDAIQKLLLYMFNRLSACKECTESSEFCPKCFCLSKESGCVLFSRILLIISSIGNSWVYDSLYKNKVIQLLASGIMKIKECFLNQSTFISLLQLFRIKHDQIQKDIVKYIFFNFDIIFRFPVDVQKIFFSRLSFDHAENLSKIDSPDFLVAFCVKYFDCESNSEMWNFLLNFLAQLKTIDKKWLISLFISQSNPTIMRNFFHFVEMTFLNSGKECSEEFLTILPFTLSFDDFEMQKRTLTLLKMFTADSNCLENIDPKMVQGAGLRSTIFLNKNMLHEGEEKIKEIISLLEKIVINNEQHLVSSSFIAPYITACNSTGNESYVTNVLSRVIFEHRDYANMMYKNKLSIPLLFSLWDGTEQTNNLISLVSVQLFKTEDDFLLKQHLAFTYYESAYKRIDPKPLVRTILSGVLMDMAINQEAVKPEDALWAFFVHCFFDWSESSKERVHVDSQVDVIENYPMCLQTFSNEIYFSFNEISLRESDELVAINFLEAINLFNNIDTKISKDLTVNSLIIAALAVEGLVKMKSIEYDYENFIDMYEPMLEVASLKNRSYAISIIIDAVKQSGHPYPYLSTLEVHLPHESSEPKRKTISEEKFERFADEFNAISNDILKQYRDTITGYLEIGPFIKTSCSLEEASDTLSEYISRSFQVFERGNSEINEMAKICALVNEKITTKYSLIPGSFYNYNIPHQKSIKNLFCNNRLNIVAASLPPEEREVVKPTTEVMYDSVATMVRYSERICGLLEIHSECIYFQSQSHSKLIMSSEIEYIFTYAVKEKTRLLVVTDRKQYVFELPKVRTPGLAEISLEKMEMKDCDDSFFGRLRKSTKSCCSKSGKWLTSKASFDSVASVYDYIFYMNLLYGRNTRDVDNYMTFPLPMDLSSHIIDASSLAELTSKSIESYYNLDAFKTLGQSDVPPLFYSVPESHTQCELASKCEEVLESRGYSQQLKKWFLSRFDTHFLFQYKELHKTQQRPLKMKMPIKNRRCRRGIFLGNNTVIDANLKTVCKAPFGFSGTLYDVSQSGFVVSSAPYGSVLGVVKTNGSNVGDLKINDTFVVSLAVDRDLVAVGCSDSSVKVYKAGGCSVLEKINTSILHSEEVTAVAVDARQNLLVSINAGLEMITEAADHGRFFGYEMLGSLGKEISGGPLPPLVAICDGVGLIVVALRSPESRRSVIAVFTPSCKLVRKAELAGVVECIDIFYEPSLRKLVLTRRENKKIFLEVYAIPTLERESLDEVDLPRMVGPAFFSVLSNCRGVALAEGESLALLPF